MDICPYALYTALTQDLSTHLPNVSEVFTPFNITAVDFTPIESVKGYASSALLKSIFKKSIDYSDGNSCDATALATFLRCNADCEAFNTAFRSDKLDTYLEIILNTARKLIDDWCYIFAPISDVGPVMPCRVSIFEPELWLKDCDFGPGASVGASGTSFLHKVSSGRLTQSQAGVYKWYVHSIRTQPSWKSSEIRRRTTFGKPDLVSGSKLSYVPKNSKTSRVICTEPSLNMFVQKGLSSALRQSLLLNCKIDLSSQQVFNRALACHGSMGGGFSTIDLKSASDTISLAIVRYLFPPEIYYWLEDTRSPSTVLPTGEVIPLHMISSMGNDFTFPLQTMIFSALVQATYICSGVTPERKRSTDERFAFDYKTCGNWGVFGDDIIVMDPLFGIMCRVLESCGFSVNRTKSFSTGSFRESCGGDYYDGHLVRGVYVTTLKTKQDVYSLINRLIDWSARTRISLFRTCEYLLGLVPFLTVPPFEDDCSGIKVPLSLAVNIARGENSSFRYKRLEARPRTVSVDYDPRQWKRRYSELRAVKLVYSPDAIFLSALKGTLRGGNVTLRSSVVRYSYRYGLVPCWDWLQQVHPLLGGVGFTVWKHTALFHLGKVE